MNANEGLVKTYTASGAIKKLFEPPTFQSSLPNPKEDLREIPVRLQDCLRAPRGLVDRE